MRRVIIGLLFVLAIVNPARGYLMTGNGRLDHVLWPQHETRLVVAGEMSRVEVRSAEANVINGPPRYVTVYFQVRSTILGSKEHQGQTLVLPATAFVWPEHLVPLKERTFCILILHERDLANKDVATSIAAVVPSRQQNYVRVASTVEARNVLSNEIVAQLRSERDERRLRDLLLQVAPILKKEQAVSVAPFAENKNPWIRRAALAGLIYATEDHPQYLKAAAQDVQDFVSRMSSTKTFVADVGETFEAYPPRSLFYMHYFFLEKSTWTWGTRWTEEEADKHQRILRAMLQFGIITQGTRNIIETGRWAF